jgi:hypothetical protein
MTNTNLVFYSGPSRTGKTTLAKKEAAETGGTFIETNIQTALKQILSSTEKYASLFLKENGCIDYNALLKNCDPSDNLAIHFALFDHLHSLIDPCVKDEKNSYVFDRHFVDVIAYSLVCASFYYANVYKEDGLYVVERIVEKHLINHLLNLGDYLVNNNYLDFKAEIVFTKIDRAKLAQQPAHSDPLKTGDIYSDLEVIDILQEAFNTAKVFLKEYRK